MTGSKALKKGYMSLGFVGRKGFIKGLTRVNCPDLPALSICAHWILV